jgi:uncharacterized membrane protein
VKNGLLNPLFLPNKTRYMMRNLLLIFSLLLFASVALGQTAVEGKVTDAETQEELFGANVVFNKNGVFITGTSTDLSGNFKVNLDPGEYDVITSYVGMSDKKITGVLIKAGQTTNLPIEMGGEGDAKTVLQF